MLKMLYKTETINTITQNFQTKQIEHDGLGLW